MPKHNYPQNRKPRNTGYSTTSKLIKHYGVNRLYEIWVKFNGMYKASEFLSEDLGEYVSPYIVRYLSNKFNWKRQITDKSLPIYLGVIYGHTPKGHYKHIEFV
jgi:hypothetical protein